MHPRQGQSCLTAIYPRVVKWHCLALARYGKRGHTYTEDYCYMDFILLEVASYLVIYNSQHVYSLLNYQHYLYSLLEFF